MKGSVRNDLGTINIKPDAIAKFAGSVAVECFGIVGMAAVNMTDGLVRLLKNDKMTRGVKVTISDNNEISIDFHVIVVYGINIPTVTGNLIENVSYQVEKFTGMPLKRIRVFVDGVRVID